MSIKHESIQQITSGGSVPASGCSCGRAQLSHLTDIWSISAHISLLIFCSMRVEKDFQISLRVPRPATRSQSPSGGCKVPRLDNLRWFDPVFSQACDLLQRDPGSEECWQILCRRAPFTAAHSPKQCRSTASRSETRLWGTLRGNSKSTKRLHHRESKDGSPFSSSDLMLVRHAFRSSRRTTEQSRSLKIALHIYHINLPLCSLETSYRAVGG